MKVGVVGLGAIGSLFFNRILYHINPLNIKPNDKSNRIYALIKESQRENLKSVAVYEKKKEILKPILHVPTDKPPNSNLFQSNFDHTNHLDIILISVKSNQTYEVAARLKSSNGIGKDSLFISVQNGLGNVKVLKDVLETDNVLHAVTYMGGVCIGTGQVIQGGDGPTIIQSADHLSDSVQNNLNRFSGLLASSGIQTSLVPSTELQSVIWTKLLVNAGINPLAAILDVANKEVVSGSSNLAVVEAIVEEVAAVAQAQNIPLQFNGMTPLEYTIAAANATGTNVCSMCHDMRRGRQTEIGAINDMIVTYGQQVGVPTPHNEMIVNIIKAMESRSR